MKRMICKPGAAKLSLKKITIADLSINPAQAEMIKGGRYAEDEATDVQTTLGVSLYSGYLGVNCPLKPNKAIDDCCVEP